MGVVNCSFLPTFLLPKCEIGIISMSELVINTSSAEVMSPMRSSLSIMGIRDLAASINTTCRVMPGRMFIELRVGS